MLIRNAVALIDGRFITGVDVRIHNGCVQELGADLQNGLYEDPVDFCGDYLLPGFVDVHIHAFKGHDTMQGESAVRDMSRDLYRQGVAAFLPTTMSASIRDTRNAVLGVRAVMEHPENRGARVLGVHMEAPFLQPDKAGAQVKAHFLIPSMETFADMTAGSNAVKLITMAPEL